MIATLVTLFPNLVFLAAASVLILGTAWWATLAAEKSDDWLWGYDE